VFLLLNGASLVATEEEKYVAMLPLAEETWTEAEFAAFPRQRIVLDASRNRVLEPRARRVGIR
jgi:death-on-curing protein